LYGKVRYIGTHAAGVAIIDGDISEYSYIKKGKDGKKYCVYDLADLEAFGVVKFDILGLQTLDTLDALAKSTGAAAEPEMATQDAQTMQAFAGGETDGIFQFERKTAKRILKDVKADTIQDIIATNAMNRPAPLKLGIPKVYANSKREAQPLHPLYGQYLTATHGCILYQEQVQAIAVNIGGVAWADADTIIKSERGSTGKKQKQFNEIYDRCLKIFVAGATEKGVSKEEAESIYDNFFNYAFNRGHATGYSIISTQEMFYKVHYPMEYWATKLQQEDDEKQRYLFKKAIVRAGIVILPPRYNGVIYDGAIELDGEKCIQEGIYSIKGIGKKAVEKIEAERKDNGDFEDVAEFTTRCKGRAVTSKTIEILVENSVFDYNDSNYIQRVVKYNASLM
jgi:DNA polymerase-3 subunit alpha